MHNETVYCKGCGKRLAWWDMFSNVQYEDEYECSGEFRRKARNVFADLEGRKVHTFVMDGGAKTVMKSPQKGMKRIKYEKLPCVLYYHTKFCISCARKRHFKCSRPRCKGKLILVRRKDGKPTKHQHGGY